MFVYLYIIIRFAFPHCPYSCPRHRFDRIIFPRRWSNLCDGTSEWKKKITNPSSLKKSEKTKKNHLLWIYFGRSSCVARYGGGHEGCRSSILSPSLSLSLSHDLHNSHIMTSTCAPYARVKVLSPGFLPFVFGGSSFPLSSGLCIRLVPRGI